MAQVADYGCLCFDGRSNNRKAGSVGGMPNFSVMGSGGGFPNMTIAVAEVGRSLNVFNDWEGRALDSESGFMGRSHISAY